MAHVLIIEDEPDTRRATRLALERAGHAVTDVAGGDEALGTVIRGHFDVILLDLLMPGMDGVTFLKVMRGYVRWDTTPVIVVTAVSDPAKLDELKEYGVVQVFRKASYDMQDLILAVANLAV
jgi:CheY-like chemotaxis protein